MILDAYHYIRAGGEETWQAKLEEGIYRNINKMDALLHINLLQNSQSSSVVKAVCAGNPETWPLLATTEQE